MILWYENSHVEYGQNHQKKTAVLRRGLLSNMSLVVAITTVITNLTLFTKMMTANGNVMGILHTMEYISCHSTLLTPSPTTRRRRRIYYYTIPHDQLQCQSTTRLQMSSSSEEDVTDALLVCYCRYLMSEISGYCGFPPAT